MKLVAVVPIRQGSQRVKNKNLKPFADTNLLELKLKNLMRVSELDEVIVNTDSDLALEIAKQYGVTGQRREAYYASSACSGSEYFEHLGKVTKTDIFLYAPVTSPFVTPETFSSCIRQFLSMQGENDSLATVSAVKEFLWKDGKPVNYDPAHAPNSQDLPEIVALNFACSLISREDLIRHKNIIGSRPAFLTIDEIQATDIDTPLDFFIAEQLYRKFWFNGKISDFSV